MKTAMRVNNNYANVDIYIGSNCFQTYYRRGAANYSGETPTMIKGEGDLETIQLRAVYAALARLTRNAIVQIHGLNDETAAKFFKARKPVTPAWKYTDAIQQVGLNGHIFDIVAVNGKANPNIDKAAIWSWTPDKHDAHLAAVAAFKAEAKADPAPVAKVETTATAKAEKAAEAKVTKRRSAKVAA